MTRRALPAAWAVSLALLSALAGCAHAPPKDYTKFLSAGPRSILIVPVVNKSVDVDAPAYFLSTLPIPVAERGYYVFPVNLVKRLLEDDGLSDASLVHGADPARLCSLFGADAVLYVSIERWDAKYLVLTTQVTVEFEYLLKDGKTGETIWADKKAMVYTPNQQSGGSPLAALISAVVSAAVTKAAPNYMPLARQANAEVMAYPGPGFPAGPYSPSYKHDLPAK
jgi:hypothetical protein